MPKPHSGEPDALQQATVFGSPRIPTDPVKHREVRYAEKHREVRSAEQHTLTATP